jgi:hypothetical protein
MAPPAQLGFSQLHEEVGVSSSGPLSVDAGVEGRGRFQIRVPQQLSDQLVSTRVGIEDYFRCEMAELVRSDFHSQISQNSFHDSDRNRILTPRPARPGDENRVGTLPDHRRGNLIAIDLETIGEHGRELELEDNTVLGFVAAESDECRLAGSLWPVQMLVEIQGR